MKNKETLQNEINELMELKRMIETHSFQTHIYKPLKEEHNKLRTAFFSDSLKESWRKGGKQEGIKLFMKLIEDVPNDLKNTLDEFNSLEQ